ncbi:MAG: flagellar basal body P-ring formation protein FlgA [Betaproteobacteria bacterium]|nr:flagellar basal body P-ring formation protein FlgA [Betaproteobacteria bacterium]MCL2885308.1 flagellar basal body P-ring formation protein FlgA [Betaproteobacteria bacterium]
MLRRLFFLCLLLPALTIAAEVDTVIDTAERYVRLQTKGMPGQVKITMGRLDVERLPPCSAHEAYTPPGTRLSGQAYIGVRCLGPNIWSVLVPVQIAVTGNYVVTARPLGAGQVLQEGDISELSGDLATLPSGVVGSAAEAVGKTLRNALGAGQPLRNDQLLAPLVIRQSQSVRVISRGAGFAVSGEGRALNNASEGQVVQVRISSSNQTISGIAKADGTVEVGF